MLNCAIRSIAKLIALISHTKIAFVAPNCSLEFDFVVRLCPYLIRQHNAACWPCCLQIHALLNTCKLDATLLNRLYMLLHAHICTVPLTTMRKKCCLSAISALRNVALMT